MKRLIEIAKPDGTNPLTVTEKAFENIYKEKGFVAIGEPVEVPDVSAPSNRRAQEFTSTDAGREVSAASIARELGLNQDDQGGGAETDQGEAGTEKTANDQAKTKTAAKSTAKAKTKTAPKKDRKVLDGKAAAKPAEVKTNESNLNNQTADNGGAVNSNQTGAGGSGGDAGKTD